MLYLSIHRPDNQEVYSLPSDYSHEGSDSNIPGPSLIVELLEYQKQVSDQDAAAYYFKDLAEANDVADADMSFTPQSLSTSPSFPRLSAFASGIGMQQITPGRTVDVAGNPRNTAAVWTKVEIGVFRLQDVQTDMLVTLSVPTLNGAGQQEAPGAFGFSETFHRAVTTLSIRNWELFG